MSREKQKSEACRWFVTAKSDLETARLLSSHERFPHACFHAQQAAEKAVKAVWYALGADPWGHSIRKLIEELQDVDLKAFDFLKTSISPGMKLDRMYIPTRYPNGLPDITPDLAYDLEDAQSAMSASEALIRRVQEFLGFDI
ncbi:MAG: HEPN domain-containing protein [Thermodesulfobacteriota bacterium]